MKMAVANKVGQIDVLLNERLVGIRIKVRIQPNYDIKMYSSFQAS